MNELTRDEVEIHIDADPRTVYDLVAEVTRMPEWSPELVSCQWLDGATGPAVGARFKAVNKLDKGRPWSNKPTVIVADPGREFAISRVEAIGGELIWGYRFEPEGSGTRMIESYEVVRQPSWLLRHVIMRRLGGVTDREADIRRGMEITLERLKATAERSESEEPIA